LMYDIHPAYNDTDVDVSGNVDATQTAIDLTGAGGIANGDTIKIGSEFLEVTAGGGTNALTVIRGFSGSTAAAHSSGTKVELGVAPLIGNHSLKASGSDHNTDNSAETNEFNPAAGSSGGQCAPLTIVIPTATPPQPPTDTPSPTPTEPPTDSPTPT